MNKVRNKMAPDVGHRYILSYFFLRHVSWLISYYVLVPLKISPNVVTVLSIASGIAAALLAINGELVLSGVMMISWALFDCCDGEVARWTGKTSKIGNTLETINSNIQYSIWLPAVAYSAYSFSHINVDFLFLSFVATSLFSIFRQYLNGVPEFIENKPDCILKLFIASQFKSGTKYREKLAIGRLFFILWRNIATQFGLFEILVVVIGLIQFKYPLFISYFVYMYTFIYLLIGGGVFVGMISLALLRGQR